MQKRQVWILSISYGSTSSETITTISSTVITTLSAIATNTQNKSQIESDHCLFYIEGYKLSRDEERCAHRRNVGQSCKLASRYRMCCRYMKYYCMCCKYSGGHK